MGDDTDTEDNVIELPKPLDYLPEAVRQQMEKMTGDTRKEPPGGTDKVVPLPVRPPPEDDGSPLSPEMMSPLPLPGDAYVAHARIANGPVSTLFFLPKGQLPDGLNYSHLERVRMVEPEKPGGSPHLLLRFWCSVIVEVRIEGRNLLGLCDYLGRHLIHWLREHPTGHDDGDDAAVFIRRITIREAAR